MGEYAKRGRVKTIFPRARRVHAAAKRRIVLLVKIMCAVYFACRMNRQNVLVWSGVAVGAAAAALAAGGFYASWAGRAREASARGALAGRVAALEAQVAALSSNLQQQAGAVQQASARSTGADTQLRKLQGEVSEIARQVGAVAQQAARTDERELEFEDLTRKTVASLNSRLVDLADALNGPGRAAGKAVPDRPAAAVESGGPVAEGVYEIKTGDTLEKIAKEHGSSIEAILEANPGIDARRLQIGQRIEIPKP
jgi:LysM repeat protein